MKKIIFIHVLIALFTTSLLVVSANGVSEAEILEYPEPNVTPLIAEDSLLYDRYYRVVTGNFSVFDNPNGEHIETLGSGFNYVTLSEPSQNGWSRIAPDRWLQDTELSEDVQISKFAGVLLPAEGLPYTMAWTLRHLRPSFTAGGEEYPENPYLYRYTRVNIYAEIELDGHRWYQIGVNQWVHQFDIAKFLPIERPESIETEKWISVDLYEQVLIAYEGSTPVFTTLVSSGLPQWSTNEGSFNIYARFSRTLMTGAYGQPDFYYLEEVPWTMYFDNDIALHGTYWHDGFGYRHSHGCVNMSITDAHWVYHWTDDMQDATVYVYSSDEYE